MKARKPRSPFDFSRVSQELAASRQAVQAAADSGAEAGIDRPPSASELDILQAPPVVEMTSEDVAPPIPATIADPSAEPPLPPAVVTRAEKFKEPSNAPIVIGAILVAALWAVAPVAFALGWRWKIEPLGDDPLAIGLFAVLAIGPAALVFVAAYALIQGRKLAITDCP